MASVNQRRRMPRLKLAGGSEIGASYSPNFRTLLMNSASEIHILCLMAKIVDIEAMIMQSEVMLQRCPVLIMDVDIPRLGQNMPIGKPGDERAVKKEVHLYLL